MERSCLLCFNVYLFSFSALEKRSSGRSAALFYQTPISLFVQPLFKGSPGVHGLPGGFWRQIGLCCAVPCAGHEVRAGSMPRAGAGATGIRALGKGPEVPEAARGWWRRDCAEHALEMHPELLFYSLKLRDLDGLH